MYDIYSPYDDDEERKRRDMVLRSLVEEQAPTVAVQLRAEDFPIEETPDAPNTRDQSLMAAREKPEELDPNEREPDADSDDSSTWNGLDVALAAFLDAGMNKGRGLGQIVGAYANNRDAAARAKEQAKLHLAEIEARKAGDPFTQWLQAERLKVQQGNLGARTAEGSLSNQRFEDSQRRYADRTDIGSALNQTALEMKEQGAGRSVRGRESEKHALNEQMADDAANLSEARAAAATKGRNEQLGETPTPISPDQAADNARQEEQLRLTRDVKRQGEVSKYLKDLGDAAKIAAHARELQDLFKTQELAGRKDMPGIGVWDSSKPDWLPERMGGPSADDRRTQAILTEFANAGMHGLGGSAVSPSEEKRLAPEFAAVKGSTEARARAAIDQIAKSTAQAIRAASVGREDIAREVLAPYGLGDLIDAPAVVPAVNPAAPAANPAAGSADFSPKGVRAKPPVAYAPDKPGELGEPVSIDASDWRERYKRFKVGVQP